MAKRQQCTWKHYKERFNQQKKLFTNLLSNSAQILTQKLKISAQCLSSLHQKAHLLSILLKKFSKKFFGELSESFSAIFVMAKHVNLTVLQWHRINNKPSIKQSSKLPKHYQIRSHYLQSFHHSSMVKPLISLEEPPL